ERQTISPDRLAACLCQRPGQPMVVKRFCFDQPIGMYQDKPLSFRCLVRVPKTMVIFQPRNGRCGIIYLVPGPRIECVCPTIIVYTTLPERCSWNGGCY